MNRIAFGRAHDRDLPIQIEQPRQRAKQQIMALARYQSADGKDVAGRATRTGRARCIVGAWPHGSDALAVYGEILDETLRGGLARRDDARETGQETLLNVEQRGAIAVGNA